MRHSRSFLSIDERQIDSLIVDSEPCLRVFSHVFSYSTFARIHLKPSTGRETQYLHITAVCGTLVCACLKLFFSNKSSHSPVGRLAHPSFDVFVLVICPN